MIVIVIVIVVDYDYDYDHDHDHDHDRRRADVHHAPRTFAFVQQCCVADPTSMSKG